MNNINILGQTEIDNVKESTSNGNNHEGEITAGEDIKCSKILPQTRSSADTVILEPCYETAEDILKELESNDKVLPASNNSQPPSKSLRDCITYSEPLTPMLQEVLDDFASEPEDSDREAPMQIVETAQDTENTVDLTEMPEADGTVPKLTTLATDIVKSATELSTEVTEEVLVHEVGGSKPEKSSPKKQTQNAKAEEELESVNKNDDSSKDIIENGKEEANENSKQDNLENVAEPVNGAINDEVPVSKGRHSDSMFDSISQNQNQNSHNTSGGTVDASLPNNPEALKNKQSQMTENKTKTSPVKLKSVEVASNSATKQTTSRKRSSSVDPTKPTEIEKKKKKLEGRLKGSLQVSKKEKSRAVTQSGIKIMDDKFETDKIKPIIRDVEEVIDLDTIQEIDTNKNVSETDKPSTSSNKEDIKPQQQPTIEQSPKQQEPEIKNPCLQNISLYDEHLNKTKYNMSESSDTEQNKKETSENTQEGTSKEDRSSKPNNVVQIPSESDADQTRSPPKKKHRPGVLTSKSERDKAVSNMFGQSGKLCASHMHLEFHLCL